jgi:EpsI family protein
MMTSSRTLVAGPVLVAFALLLSATGLLWAGADQRLRSGSSAREVVPQTVGEWSGTPMPVDQRALEILETDDVAALEYRRGQEPPLWFAQVAGFGNRAAFHPPELCYVGSHYEVLERGPVTVTINGRSRDVMRLVISQGKEQFEAWYWFTANDRVTSNYYQQQMWLVFNTIQGRPTSGTLVRISTPIDQPEQARQRLLAFVESWDRAILTRTAQGI